MTGLSRELLKLREKIPYGQIENFQAYLVPERIRDLSDKDKARLIVALGEQLKYASMVADANRKYLVDLLAPVSGQ